MQVQPYLFFDGRCEEAVLFYKKALGAKVEMLMRYKESPEPPPIGKTFWSPRFGMVTDRFGVSWMINVVA